MCLNMLSQMTALSESLLTLVASVWLLTPVYSLVAGQRTALCTAVFTLVACVWLLHAVDSLVHVHGQTIVTCTRVLTLVGYSCWPGTNPTVPCLYHSQWLQSLT